MLGTGQTHRVDHALFREIEFPVQVEMPPGGHGAVANAVDQFRPSRFIGRLIQ